MLKSERTKCHSRERKRRYQRWRVLQNIGQVLQKRGIRRLRSRRVAANHSAVAIDQEFLEIPAYVSGKAVLLGGQPGVEGMAMGAVDLDLCGQRESHPIGEGAKALNLRRRTGFLRAELVAGESDHGEIALLELLVEIFQARILRRIAALARDVH